MNLLDFIMLRHTREQKEEILLKGEEVLIDEEKSETVPYNKILYIRCRLSGGGF